MPLSKLQFSAWNDFQAMSFIDPHKSQLPLCWTWNLVCKVDVTGSGLKMSADTECTFSPCSGLQYPILLGLRQHFSPNLIFFFLASGFTHWSLLCLSLRHLIYTQINCSHLLLHKKVGTFWGLFCSPYHFLWLFSASESLSSASSLRVGLLSASALWRSQISSLFPDVLAFKCSRMILNRQSQWPN